jgi:hypothetical protein
MNQQNLEAAMATVHALLRAEGLSDAANLVRDYPARAEHTGNDGWNGGTEIWEISLDVPPEHYARLGAQRGNLEGQITERLRTVLANTGERWYAAKIVPALEQRADWRTHEPGLPRQARVNILDGLRLDKVVWYGALDDVEFLRRIYDLTNLPSTDSRYTDAAGDIWQHTVNNSDWDMDWVYHDKRFNLVDGPTDKFLQFLCELVHPVVRPDREEAETLVVHFNDQLRPCGWEIVIEERIAGRPRYAPQALTNNGARAVQRARGVAASLDAGAMAQQIHRLENAVEKDPALAIGTAKELVETCCKTILTKRGVEFTRTEDIGDLTKKVTKALELVPEGISDAAKGAANIRLILHNLSSITHNLARLRGLYGTGHGMDGAHRGLQPRHARLAVAAAVAFIDFVTETDRVRSKAKVES